MRKHGSSFDYLPNATVESLNLPPKVFFLIMRRHPGVTDITAVILFFRRIIILDKPAVPAESTGATEQRPFATLRRMVLTETSYCLATRLMETNVM